VPLGRGLTGEGRGLGALRAINANGSPGARLVKESRLQAPSQITPLDIEDGLKRNLHREAIASGCSPQCRRPSKRVRVCVLAVVVPRLMMVVKERSSVLHSLIGCVGLAMFKR
jgi:hypothetical protein